MQAFLKSGKLQPNKSAAAGSSSQKQLKEKKNKERLVPWVEKVRIFWRDPLFT